MIDLNELKDRARKHSGLLMFEVDPNDIAEICERAIAAESERDELKAKLEAVRGELEKRTGLLEQERNKRVSLELDLESAQSKLADMEKQEPVATVEQMNQERYFSCLATSYGSKPKFCDKIYAQPKPSAPAQHITEQDALAIIKSWEQYSNEPFRLGVDDDNWFKDRGLSLLAKLNEHRAPEAGQDPVAYIPVRAINKLKETELFSTIISASDVWSDCAVMPVYAEPVTANKAEVPEGWKLVPEKLTTEMFLAFEHCKSSDLQECWKEMLSAAQLPPLKDGE